MQTACKEGEIKLMSADNLKIIELAKSIKTWSQVLRASINLLDDSLSDDSLALQLDIDRGNFSRILKGQSNFPFEKLIKFCRIVGHDLPLHWLAYQGGYELKVLPKTLEEEIRKERGEKEKALATVAYLEGLLSRMPGNK